MKGWSSQLFNNISLRLFKSLFLKSDQRFNNNINLWDNNIISLSLQLIPKDIRYNQTSGD